MFGDALTKLFGFGEDTAIEEVRLDSLWPPVLLAVLVVAAIAYTVYLYRRERRISPARRVLLGIFRALAYSILLLILFEPVIAMVTTVTVRRDVLVLVDKSESMAIKDVRKKPEDLVDAALALGKAAFIEPVQQRELARATRAMRSADAALKAEQLEDALEAQHKAVQAMLAALRDKEAAPDRPGGNPGGQTEALDALRRILQGQTALIETAMRLKERGKVGLEQLRDLRDRQGKLLDDLSAIAATVPRASIGLTEGVTAQATEVSRMDLAKGLVSTPDLKVLEELEKQYNVRWFTFGESLQEAAGKDERGDNVLAGTRATEQYSRGGRAIEDAVNKFSGQPIAGVVLLTDGAFNSDLDALAVARSMREKGVRLYPVGLGLPAPDDVGLRSLIAQEVVFPKDTVSLRVQVFSHGYSGREVSVTVFLDDALVAEKLVELTERPQFVEVSFVVPETAAAGRAKLAVTVSELAGEVTTANNRVEQTVRILTEKIKVLYVEGKPRWEYRYLRAVLFRDRRLDVKFLMTQGDRDLAAASDRYLARYPEDADEAFGFDLVILGDVPAHYFTSEQLKRMVELVRDRGGSLLMLAGHQHAPATYVDTPIAKILPVQITREFEPVDPEVYPVATAKGRRGLARLDPSDQKNREVWGLVKPMYQVPRLTGAKAAHVLAVLPVGPDRAKPYPLVAWQYAGTGKVMYVGTDQLWRLRFKRGDYYHAKFWGQAIQFLALSRLLGENRRIRIETDRNKYFTGQRAEVHVNVLNELFQPSAADDYTVYIERPGSGADAVVKRLEPLAGTPGLFHGVHPLEHKGHYRIRTAPDDERYSNVVEFEVAGSAREKLEPAMQEAQLRKMAELSGGQYFPIREWPALAGSLEGKVRTLSKHKDEDLWDSWILYVLLITCLGVEWSLRRMFYLT